MVPTVLLPKESNFQRNCRGFVAGLICHNCAYGIGRAVGTAHNSLINLEDSSQEERDVIKADSATIAVKARNGKVTRSSVTVAVMEK